MMDKSSPQRRARRPQRVLGPAGVLVGALLLTAACSSSGSSSSAGASEATGSASSTGTAAAPAGSTISLGIITDTGTAVDQPDEVAAVKGAVRDLNAHGGINGHQVALVYCNENLDPNQARACARQLIGDHVMAFVGNAVVTAEPDVDKLMAAAGIANVGPTSYSGASGNDPNSFLFTPGFDYSNAALALYAVKSAGPKVAQVMLDSPITANYVPVISGTVGAVGGQYVSTVKAPQVSSDLSPQAATLLSASPDAVITNTSDAGSLQVIKDMAQLGYHGKFVSGAAQFLQSDLSSLGALANQIQIVSPFPPASDTGIPGIARFHADMLAEKAAGDSAAPVDDQIVRAPAMSGWLAVMAVQTIADSAKATTATEFEKAIKAASNVDLMGVIPPWTPNKAVSGPITRVSWGSFYDIGWKDGKATLLNQAPVDVTSYVNKFYPKS
jgi:ABC-type branched-subunit amino acid transport system substrate-binding protein